MYNQVSSESHWVLYKDPLGNIFQDFQYILASLHHLFLLCYVC
jgi:hypothetical protein